ncbi:ribonuclease T2 [Bombina bombina]|uniref:ribonuclease T2 n=1 Tax=Bombina bombina TaxID=8345 RepID=UPI00235B2815|nr:ribonuclease T2 [Bombina bombina]
MAPIVRIALVLVLTFQAVQCTYRNDPSFSSRQHEWSKLILTHHWPVTVCKMDGVHCENPPNYWTVHGLWPEKSQMCNNSWHFDPSQIQEIMTEMNKCWPDVLHPNRTQLWKHEWQKHGTCAASLECLNTQLKYFSKALEMYKNVDLNSALEKAGIKPSKSYYKMSDIKNAMLNIYGVMPKFQCVPPQQGENAQTLGQIEICFTKEIKARNCTHNLDEPEIKWDSYNEELQVCDDNLCTYYPPVNEL